MSVVMELMADGERVLRDGSKDDAKRFIDEACDVLEDCGVSNPRRGLEASSMRLWTGRETIVSESDTETYMADVRTLVRRLRTIEERSPSVSVENRIEVTVTIQNVVDSVRKNDSIPEDQREEIVSMLEEMRAFAEIGNKRSFLDKLSQLVGLSADAATLIDILSKAMPILFSILMLQ